MAAAGPHVVLKGETVVSIYGFNVTNSLISSLIVTAFFAIIAYAYYSESQKKEKSVFFYTIHGVISALYALFESILKKNVKIFFPLLSSFFFFIILNNWFGLFPLVNSYYVTPITIGAEAPKMQTNGSTEKPEKAKETTSHSAKTNSEKESSDSDKPHKVPLLRGATADLNTTIALALISVVLTQIFGFRFIGAAEHLKKYASPIGILEGFSEISRLLSFSFRLFGNIFAGEVMIGVIAFLAFFLTPPFFLLEVFVGFIQAVVFSMLTAVFINMAIQKHH
ncbi:MAG: F0F1 ATP synthase subunit A [Patescibacteria group bacterium]|nr:F0F1 ATP synthase subunit A [Patescibacteria group bacterium]